MHRWLKTLATVAALIAVSSAANDLSDLRGAAEAMACCAKTDYQCAGVNTPDDCCAHMHHAPAHPVPATAAGNRVAPHAKVATPPSASPLLRFTPSVALRITGAKRPHDPPHLHTFSLLI